jgi:hypothetical protein
MLSAGWGSNKVRKNRRGIRKSKVRWEVLGLQSPLAISMDDIRQQVAHMTNSWLEQAPPIITQRSGERERK